MNTMNVSMKVILKNTLFENARILAGKAGLERKVKRISVFDCPCSEALIQRNIINEGDAYITGLEQFKYEQENIYLYMDTLIAAKCAGVFVVTDEMIHVLKEDVLRRCEEADFPVVLIPEDHPYALIIDTVNKYIAIDNLNVINSLKLEKIMFGNVSSFEKMEVLYSINPDIGQYLRVINVEGEFTSNIAMMELHFYYMNQKNDIYVRNKNYITFILSESSERALKHHSDATAARFAEFIENPVVGYSRIYPRKDIGNALEEARRSLDTAKAMHMTSQTYDPISVLQLLLPVRDTQEAHDFYGAYVAAIQETVSADNLRETLRTMECFVANSGNFQITAAEMNQHENTIRYRVNKVKAALNMEDDAIKFHETLAIAVKLRTLIGEEL